jgi:predicted RNase H-like nuclease
MSQIIGIDGCRAGWIAASFQKNQITFQLLHSLQKLISTNEKQYIGIDMPVYLSDHEFREADQEARRLLKRRAATVFSAPITKILHAISYKDACQLSFKLTGKKISKQSWNLFPKIKDVQQVKNKFQGVRIFYEIHPELSFMAMNKMEILEISKKLAQGKEMRLNLIKSIYPSFNFKKVRKQFLKKDVSDDDILDAIAVLWSTHRIVDNIAESIPSNSEDTYRRIFF